MSLLRVLQWLPVVVTVVAAFMFTMYNANTRIDLIKLPFTADRSGVLLVELMLYPLALGFLVGIGFTVFGMLRVHTQLRSEKRQRQRLQTELTALRNLPLEDVESGAGAGGDE